MAISFLSRSLTTASAASPLVKRYCIWYCVGGRESSSNRSRVTSPREPRDFAPPQDAFERLRRLRHLLSRKLDRSKLLLYLADLIASVFELVSHLRLRVGSHLAGDLGRIANGILQGRRDAIETLRDALGDSFQLAGAFGLRRRNRLQVTAQFVHLRFDCFALLPALGTLQNQPENQDRHKNHHADQGHVHSFSNASTKSRLLTLLAILCSSKFPLKQKGPRGRGPL